MDEGRYVPSKRIRGLHRRAKSTQSLKAFAACHAGGRLTGDWIANKDKTGRGRKRAA